MGYGFGALNDYVDRAHANAKAKGFWDRGGSRAVVDGRLATLMLITTEVAEAAEAVRHDDAENLAEELADICIRVFDFAGFLGINLEQAIVNKMAKNEERPAMHGKLA